MSSAGRQSHTTVVENIKQMKGSKKLQEVCHKTLWGRSLFPSVAQKKVITGPK
jgi:hypothetical protein